MQQQQQQQQQQLHLVPTSLQHLQQHQQHQHLLLAPHCAHVQGLLQTLPAANLQQPQPQLPQQWQALPAAAPQYAYGGGLMPSQPALAFAPGPATYTAAGVPLQAAQLAPLQWVATGTTPAHQQQQQQIVQPPPMPAVVSGNSAFGLAGAPPPALLQQPGLAQQPQPQQAAQALDLAAIQAQLHALGWPAGLPPPPQQQ
jgi:hypothetical protein